MQGITFTIGDCLFEKNLLSLGYHQRGQGLDAVPAQVCRGSVQEILVDIGKHAGRSLEIAVCSFEGYGIMAGLLCGMTGEYGGDVEDGRGFFVSEGVLRGGLVGKGIVPISQRDS